MNPKTASEAKILASKIERGLLALSRDRVKTIICPPLIFVPAIRHSLHFASLGVQNLSAKDEGPYTGEVSAYQLLEFGVRYALIGHSERRALGETNELINQKIKICQKCGIEPVFCIGAGTKKTDSLKKIKELMKKQIEEGLRGIDLHQVNFPIAYEPVWAISRGLPGTGKAVSPEHASEVINFIKKIVSQAKVLYGGSVDRGNIMDFAESKVIDGVLVGGASLNAVEFLEIIKGFER